MAGTDHRACPLLLTLAIGLFAAPAALGNDCTLQGVVLQRDGGVPPRGVLVRIHDVDHRLLSALALDPEGEFCLEQPLDRGVRVEVGQMGYRSPRQPLHDGFEAWIRRAVPHDELDIPLSLEIPVLTEVHFAVVDADGEPVQLGVPVLQPSGGGLDGGSLRNPPRLVEGRASLLVTPGRYRPSCGVHCSGMVTATYVDGVRMETQETSPRIDVGRDPLQITWVVEAPRLVGRIRGLSEDETDHAWIGASFFAKMRGGFDTWMASEDAARPVAQDGTFEIRTHHYPARLTPGHADAGIAFEPRQIVLDEAPEQPVVFTVNRTAEQFCALLVDSVTQTPVAGMPVMYHGCGASGQVTTDDDGAFTGPCFEDCAVGFYVRSSHGYPSRRFRMQQDACTVGTHRFELPSGTTVHGIVYDAGKQPAVGLKIQVMAISGCGPDSSCGFGPVITDSEGKFSFVSRNVEFVHLRLERPPDADARHTLELATLPEHQTVYVDFRNGPPKPLELAALPAARICVELQDESGALIKPYDLHLSSTHAPTPYRVLVNLVSSRPHDKVLCGNFLAPGDYRVQVSDRSRSVWWPGSERPQNAQTVRVLPGETKMLMLRLPRNR